MQFIKCLPHLWLAAIMRITTYLCIFTLMFYSFIYLFILFFNSQSYVFQIFLYRSFVYYNII